MKTLVRHGNSLALVIDKPILDLLHIDDDTPLEIATKGDSLIVTPFRDTGANKQLVGALEWVNTRYGNALKRLAE
jgi:antitoxin MazE